MTTTRWEKGDLVQFKAGGPPMLVDVVHELGGAVRVKWHVEGMLTFGTFPSDALTPYVPPPRLVEPPGESARGSG
ncbi:MAG: hypothetical protein IT373_33655 [Polyangiaceae bacterium]|nr:hypothetical protein [Polyangiaceae bacterium]